MTHPVSPTSELPATIEDREALYWDAQVCHLTEADLRQEKTVTDAIDVCYVALVGDVDGKRILDLGCGSGIWSVYFAQQGAEVWAVDISPESVAVTRRRAAMNGVATRVHATVMSVTTLEYPSDYFDLAIGKDILHHVGADALGEELARVLRTDGRAVFCENSANNPLLMFGRRHLCGRWGIPKWSSEDEYPLTREKITRIARFFRHTESHFPRFLFFHYLDAKIFGYRHRLINKACCGLDFAIHRLLPFLRKYSYRQVILFQGSHLREATCPDETL